MTFSLTRAQLEQKRQTLAQAGVVLVGDSGVVEHTGVTLRLDYLEPVQTLVITIVSKPFFVPEAVIEGKIRGWFS